MLLSTLKQIDKDEIVLLCGAGVSYDSPSSIPTVNSFIHNFLNTIIGILNLNPNIVDIFNSQKCQPRFEMLLDEIVNVFDRDIEIANLFNSKNYNLNHSLVGHLVKDGAKLITTNFDVCVENFLDENDFTKKTFQGIDIDCTELKSVSANIIKPHGCIENFNNKSLVITLSNMNLLRRGFINFPNWRNYLLKILNDKYLIVLGYSGSDTFDITPILEASNPKKIIWIEYNPNLKNISRIFKKESALNNRILKLKNLSLYQGEIVQLNEAFNYSLDSIEFVEENLEEKILKFIKSKLKSRSKKGNFLFTLFYYHNCYKLISELYCENQFFKTGAVTLNYIRALYKLGKYKEVIKECLKRLKKKNNIQLENRIFHHISASYYYEDNYDLAIFYTNKLIENSLDHSDFVSLIDGYVQLGSFQINMGKKLESQKYYRKAENILETFNYINGEGMVNWGLGNVYTLLDNRNLALEYFYKSLNIYTAIGLTQPISQLHYNIGSIYVDKKDREGALKHFTKALKEATNKDLENTNTFSELYALMGIAKTYMKFNEFKKAFKYSSELIRKLDLVPGYPCRFEAILINSVSKYKLQGSLPNNKAYFKYKQSISDKEEEFKSIIIEILSNSKEGNYEKLDAKIDTALNMIN